MGEIELALLDYYHSQPVEKLTAQEMDEYLYLLVKRGLELHNEETRGT